MLKSIDVDRNDISAQLNSPLHTIDELSVDHLRCF